MDTATKWLDSFVLMTNLYNDCALDYYVQSFGNFTNSISGIINLFTNLMFRFFSSDDETIFTNMSTAVNADNLNDTGLYFGQFMKVLFVAEIPVETTVNVDRYT